MARERSFCRYCGALTVNLDRCCRAHRHLLERDRHVPPDPFTTLPTLAEQAARMLEDVTPNEETED